MTQRDYRDAQGRIDDMAWRLYDGGLQSWSEFVTAAFMPAIMIVQEAGVPSNRLDLPSHLVEDAAYTLLREAHKKAYQKLRKELRGK